jgi:hypothetical protein
MYKKLHLKVFITAVMSCIVFTGCEDIDRDEDQKTVVPTQGVLILNQGSWGRNNSSLSWHDFSTGETTEDIMNGRLGDTAQDIIVYGGKIYVSVTMSNVIWVLSANDFSDIMKIELGEQIREPNYMAAYSGKVYATTNSGFVIRIDTAGFDVDFTAVGAYPEGIAIVNDNIYAGNTNSRQYPYDSTLSIVNTGSFMETGRVTVGVNPNRMRADDKGNIYISYRGNYGYYEPFIPGGFRKLDTKTGAVAEIDIPANQDFTIIDDTLYYFGVTYNEDWTTNNFFGSYDLKTGHSQELIHGADEITTPYALGIDPYCKDIYIADTDYETRGKIFVYDRNGVKKNEFTAGLNPCRFVFK